MKNGKHFRTLFITENIIIAALIALCCINYKFITRSVARFACSMPELPAPENNSPSGIEVSYADAVWIHKVNTVEKLRSVQDRFSGIEMDVAYIDGRFFMGHWPEEQPSGLVLDSMLGALSDISRHRFWIDFKNLADLDETEARAALDTLSAITARHGLPRERMIIESTTPQKLTAFTDAGFKTSYWIPSPRINYATTDEIAGWYEKVVAGLKQTRVSTLSGNYQCLPYVMRYFPEHTFMAFGLNSNLKVILIDEK